MLGHKSKLASKDLASKGLVSFACSDLKAQLTIRIDALENRICRLESQVAELRRERASDVRRR